MVRLAWGARGPEGIFLVTDAVPAVGLPPGEYRVSGQRILVEGNTARLDDGRLAGSLLRMNQAVANLAAWTGDLAGALQAASETPARALGMSISKGKLEPGCDADLVLLDNQLNVLETIVGGRTVYRE
jgi:N-acetylglucosamine-6-phosphate deacetylase